MLGTIICLPYLLYSSGDNGHFGQREEFLALFELSSDSIWANFSLSLRRVSSVTKICSRKASALAFADSMVPMV